MRVLVAIAVALVGTVALTVAALAGGSDEASATPRSVVKVTLTDRAIDAGSAPVRAGRVTIEELNAGSVDHDLLLVRTDRAPDDIPLGLEGPAPELAGDVVFGEKHSDHDHASGAAGEHHIAAGARRQRTVTLKPGKYVLLCPVPGHYAAGQRVALEVR